MWVMVVMVFVLGGSNSVAITTIPNFPSEQSCLEQAKILHNEQSRPSVLTYCLKNRIE